MFGHHRFRALSSPLGAWVDQEHGGDAALGQARRFGQDRGLGRMAGKTDRVFDVCGIESLDPARQVLGGGGGRDFKSGLPRELTQNGVVRAGLRRGLGQGLEERAREEVRVKIDAGHGSAPYHRRRRGG